MKPVIDSVSALWRKAEREAYRTFHAASKQHKADHFFNFCVTAHSLRDFFLETLNVPRGPARKPYHSDWDSDSLFVAVKEIANLSKHFQLRDFQTGHIRDSKTQRLDHKPGTAYDVFVTPTGAITMIPRPTREILVTTGDGSKYDMWEFQIDVLDEWRVFLRKHGIRVRRQSIAQMLDHPLTPNTR